MAADAMSNADQLKRAIAFRASIDNHTGAFLDALHPTFDRAFVALHPFWGHDDLPPLTTYALDRSGLPHGHPMRLVGEAEEGPGYGSYVKSNARTVRWSEVVECADLQDIGELYHGMLSLRQWLKPKFHHESAAQAIRKCLGTERLVLPEEDNIAVSLELQLGEVLKAVGVETTVVGHPLWTDETVEVPVSAFLDPLDSVEDTHTRFREYALSMDRRIMICCGWNQLFSLICFSAETDASAIESCELEGFWCTATTDWGWYIDAARSGAIQ